MALFGNLEQKVKMNVLTIPQRPLYETYHTISADLGKGMCTVATREKFIKWEVICAAVSGSGSLLCPGGAKCYIPAYGTDQATSGPSEVLIAADLPLHLYRRAYMRAGVQAAVGRLQRGHRRPGSVHTVLRTRDRHSCPPSHHIPSLTKCQVASI